MNSKKNEKQVMLVMAAVIFVLGFFMLLHASTLMAENSSLSILIAFLNAPEHMLAHPADIKITSDFTSHLFIYIIIYAFVIATFAIDDIRNRHYKMGAENGTAYFDTDIKNFNKKYTDPIGSPKNDGKNNMILTKDIAMSMESFKTKRNNNVLVVGGSGSGKSRFFVKPNILQANCNYVVTDPAGELLSTTGQFLIDQGYDLKVFNLVEMSKSDQYNPFNYIRDDLGVLMMINCLIKNTNPEGKGAGDPFWEKSETALLQALCFYLIKYAPEKNRNFTAVMKMLRAAEIDENDASRKSNLDRLFDEVALKDPNSIALKQYLTFKMGAGKTLKSILISCSVRLTVFNMKQIENLTKTDTIDLGGMGEGKKALFVIIPAADDTYNFLVSMMYSQLFETLYFVAETKCEHQRLPRQVRFLLDEFANIGQIPGFTKKLATMRKYGISCSVILQNLAQIKTMYKDDWESIVGNCDSFLFLGGQEYSTLEYISKSLGKTTITVRNRSMSKGKSGSSSASFNQTARDLMSPDEIMKMPKDECILIINGLAPFKGKKYDYLSHPNYKYTGDADPKKVYINTRDNSAAFSLIAAEEKIEKKKAMDAAKRNLYENTRKAFDQPPVPTTRGFAGLTFNGVRAPESIDEVNMPKVLKAEDTVVADNTPHLSQKNNDKFVQKNEKTSENIEKNQFNSVFPSIKDKDNIDIIETPKKTEIKKEKIKEETPPAIKQKKSDNNQESDNEDANNTEEYWDFTSYV